MNRKLTLPEVAADCACGHVAVVLAINRTSKDVGPVPI